MKRIIFTLLIMSTVAIGWFPSQADGDYPAACIAHPELTVSGDGHPDASITVNPVVSVDCAPWNGDFFELDHPVEAIYIEYWIEHQYREAYTADWQQAEHVNHHIVSAEDMASSVSASPHYVLSAALLINPGDTGNRFHRYRLVVHIAGYESGFNAPPYTQLDTFEGYFQSDWVEYTVEYPLNPVFEPTREDLDDYSAPTREEDAPIGTLRGR